MSFPYRGLIEQNVHVPDNAADLTVNIFEAFLDDIDVSAIVAYGSLAKTQAASAADLVAMGLEDGGAAGAGTTNLGTEIGGDTLAWTANTPKQMVMSTTLADVDKGDWINGVYNETGSVDPDAAGFHISATYGIPGGIT